MKKWDDLDNGKQKLIIQLGVLAAFLVAALPFGIWSAIDIEKRPYWLETMAWAWPLAFCGCLFMSILGYMIYEDRKQRNA